MVIEPFDVRVIDSTDVTDIFTLIQQDSVPGANHFVNIDAIGDEEESTGGHIIGMERPIVCAKRAGDLFLHSSPSKQRT